MITSAEGQFSHTPDAKSVGQARQRRKQASVEDTGMQLRSAPRSDIFRWPNSLNKSRDGGGPAAPPPRPSAPTSQDPKLAESRGPAWDQTPGPGSDRPIDHRSSIARAPEPWFLSQNTCNFIFEYPWPMLLFQNAPADACSRLTLGSWRRTYHIILMPIG